MGACTIRTRQFLSCLPSIGDRAKFTALPPSPIMHLSMGMPHLCVKVTVRCAFGRVCRRVGSGVCEAMRARVWGPHGDMSILASNV